MFDEVLVLEAGTMLLGAINDLRLEPSLIGFVLPLFQKKRDFTGVGSVSILTD